VRGVLRGGLEGVGEVDLNERQLHLNCIHETAVNQFAWLVESEQ